MEYKKVKLDNQEIEIPININDEEIEQSYFDNTIDLKKELDLANQILEKTTTIDKSDLYE